MKTRSLFSTSIIFFILSAQLNAQQTFNAPEIKSYNFTSFTPFAQKVISNDLAEHTIPKFITHPEYGILPFNAPCTECSEIIEKRTANTRYYIKNGTDGKKFYSQAAMSDLHYKNAKGEIITIDPRLFPDPANPGIYKA
ncbi:MAG: hypothetical protein ACHQFW_11620, partial [Chitinophagales bacterium]